MSKTKRIVKTAASWLIVGVFFAVLFSGLSSLLSHAVDRPTVEAQDEFGQSYETQIRPIENEQS